MVDTYSGPDFLLLIEEERRNLEIDTEKEEVAKSPHKEDDDGLDYKIDKREISRRRRIIR